MISVFFGVITSLRAHKKVYARMNTQTLWQLYQTTHFVMEQPLSNQLSFAILTAFNPRGETAPAARNRVLDRCFQQQVEEEGILYREIWGCSPDYLYCEKSWALMLEQSQAVAWAERYQQNAIFYVEQDELLLVPCLLEEQTRSLGRFSERLSIGAVERVKKGLRMQ